ncbi:MAG TPA: NrfD/PsrC family molybdoenzyme membrane anchor subunit, partial [Cyclobacteriaceae bacterium]
HTAAKCNYCAHRVDVGLEPACVNVCPEHAIVSGDMDDPNSEIAEMLAREQLSVRKPEKGTQPNVYYINGDEASLNPSSTERSDQYIWSSQKTGVGHYAKFAEKLAAGKNANDMLAELDAKQISYSNANKKSVEVLMDSGKPRRVYDTPDKGILWGWEVSAYILTKAISSGMILILSMGWLMSIEVENNGKMFAGSLALIFLAITGALLVKDLDQPKRFLYVLFRPQWKSWLAKGAYVITFFGALISGWVVSLYFEANQLANLFFMAGALFAVMVAVYTAFLFAQSKGRDFWQSPTLVLHMFVHSLMAGSAVFLLAASFISTDLTWLNFNTTVLMGSTMINLILMLIELTITHPTHDAKRVVAMITTGRYKVLFWVGAIAVGNALPLLLVTDLVAFPEGGALLVLIGIFITEKIWVEAPQRIPLT